MAVYKVKIEQLITILFLKGKLNIYMKIRCLGYNELYTAAQILILFYNKKYLNVDTHKFSLIIVQLIQRIVT